MRECPNRMFVSGSRNEQTGIGEARLFRIDDAPRRREPGGPAALPLELAERRWSIGFGRLQILRAAPPLWSAGHEGSGMRTGGFGGDIDQTGRGHKS